MPVNSTHQDYDKYKDQWRRCRDTSDGQDAVHKAGELYLPKLTDQPQADYVAYVKRATFYNATWRTIAGLVGMMFRKPPAISAPEPILPLLEDVTLSGVPFHVFLQDVSTETLEVGRLGVLVDYPAVASANLTQADAAAMNLRPTMQMYTTENIVNWRVERIQNELKLVLVVLKECRDKPKDEFTTEKEDVYRVLDLETGVYRIRIMKRENDQDVVLSESIPLRGGVALDFIPFVFVGVEDVSEHVEEPPLIDLVDMNLSHYRTTADLEHGAHFTALPTAVITGHTQENPNDKLYIGSTSAWVFPRAEADAKFLEFTGQGLEALERRLESKEKAMAILGARMLEPQRKAVETAEAETIHRKGEESQLAAAAQSISLAMTRALRWFIWWAGVEPVDEDKVELNRDFYPSPMTATDLSALVSAWQQGAISDQTLFENLQAGEIIAQGKTLEEEQAQIEEGQQKIAQRTAELNALVNPEGQQPQPE